jgi:hypothetical protein
MLSSRQQTPADQSTQTVVLANPLGAILWDQYQSGHIPIKGWFLESWESGLLELGYQRRVHYLRLSVNTTGPTLILRISESRNLKQSNGRIHKNAKVWVQLLEADIREALGRASAAKRLLPDGDRTD